MKELSLGSTKGPKELETTSAAKKANFTNNKAKQGTHKAQNLQISTRNTGSLSSHHNSCD
jgi:hypothetical protein